jgi:hypothetical protein
MNKQMVLRRNLGAGLLGLALLVSSGCGGGGGEGLDATAASSQGACSNQATCPVANAGPDQKVPVGSVATLDGSGSLSKTPALLTYQWTLSSKPKTSTATLANATTVRPTITPDVAGTYSAKLVVNTGGLLSNADSVTISAAVGDLAPIANAGPDRTVLPGTDVTLNGTGSHDPDGQPITTFAWT